MSIINRTSGIRRVVMAAIVVAGSSIAIGVAATAAQAQNYAHQYNHPAYGAYPYDYGYRHYAWWRWHQYWRAYHQYYGR